MPPEPSAEKAADGGFGEGGGEAAELPALLAGFGFQGTQAQAWAGGVRRLPK